MLFWLQGQPQHHSEVSEEIARPLCWFIHAEGREDHIWEWLEIVARSYKTSSAYESAKASCSWGDRIRWTHHLLAGLISAHLAWAKDYTANSAVKQFDKALKTFKRDLNKTIPMVGTRVALSRALKEGRRPPCDAARYEDFTVKTRLLETDPKHEALETAGLKFLILQNQIQHPC